MKNCIEWDYGELIVSGFSWATASVKNPEMHKNCVLSVVFSWTTFLDSVSKKDELDRVVACEKLYRWSSKYSSLVQILVALQRIQWEPPLSQIFVFWVKLAIRVPIIASSECIRSRSNFTPLESPSLVALEYIFRILSSPLCDVTLWWIKKGLYSLLPLLFWFLLAVRVTKNVRALDHADE